VRPDLNARRASGRDHNAPGDLGMERCGRISMPGGHPAGIIALPAGHRSRQQEPSGSAQNVILHIFTFTS